MHGHAHSLLLQVDSFGFNIVYNAYVSANEAACLYLLQAQYHAINSDIIANKLVQATIGISCIPALFLTRPMTAFHTYFWYDSMEAERVNPSQSNTIADVIPNVVAFLDAFADIDSVVPK